MKVLIWIACIFCSSFLIVLLKYGGATLGGIPSFILYAATFWLAGKLCKNWDERNGTNQNTEGQTDKSPKHSVMDNIASSDNYTFACQKCKTQLTGWYKECPYCHSIDTIVKKELVSDSVIVQELDKFEEESTCEKDGSASTQIFIADTNNEDTIAYCRKCGFKLAEGSNFCKKCGTPVIRLDSATEKTTPITSQEESSRSFTDLKEESSRSMQTEKEDPISAPVVSPDIINLLDKNLPPKIKRAFLFIEDEEWEKADNYLEAVLDEDPTNAFAYIGKTMVNLKIPQVAEFAERSEEIKENKYFQKALRFAPEELKAKLLALQM